MSDGPKLTSPFVPTSCGAIRLLTAVTVGVALLTLSGVTLVGAVIALIMASPILIIFSPILVSIGIVLFLITGGFLFSGAFGVAAMVAWSWIYYNCLAEKCI